MKKATALALAAIALVSVLIRILPLWTFVVWGSDTAEYFRIVRGLLSTGLISTTYYGWGITYPYFPGMFFPQAALAGLGGLEPIAVVSLLVPVLGGLGVLPMFLIAQRITHEDRFALFAAAFLAVANPHAYATAHVAPATLGDLLALTGLLLFLCVGSDRRAALPLLLTAGALIVTHHLAAYFFLLMVLAAIVIGGLVRPWSRREGRWREATIATGIGTGLFAFWFGYAVPFRDTILRDVDVEPWWIVLAAFPILLAVLAAAIFARSRADWRYRPRYPDLRRALAGWVTAAAALTFAGILFTTTSVPGTAIRPPTGALLYFAPTAALISFAAGGRRFFDFLRFGFQPGAWFLALLGSAILGIVAAPRVLIPYRHTEFLMFPLAIFAGVGFFRLLGFVGGPALHKIGTIVLAGALFSTAAVTALPPPEALDGWREGTLPQGLDSALWSREHVSGLLVSDHVGSMTAFGFGDVNATWDRTRAPFLSEYAGDPYAGLSDIPSPSGIKDATYVWIDRDMASGVRLTPFESAIPISPEVRAKFEAAPFVKVFDNGYAQIYWVAWGCAPTTC